MGHTSRILLVDDNALQSATRRTILETTGVTVAVAQEGQHALDLLTESDGANAFSLIITDHLMPVMSGPELVAEVRRRSIDLPIIVLSGLPDAEAAYDGLDVVFQLKPCNPDTLIGLVQELLGERLQRSA